MQLLIHRRVWEFIYLLHFWLDRCKCNVPEDAEPIEDFEPDRYFFFFNLIFSFSRFFCSFSSFSLLSLSSFSLLSFSFFSSFSFSTFNFSLSFSSFSLSLSYKIRYIKFAVYIDTEMHLDRNHECQSQLETCITSLSELRTSLPLVISSPVFLLVLMPVLVLSSLVLN